MIQCYKTRTYDEDLANLKNSGGKFNRLTFSNVIVGVENIVKKLKINLDTGLTGGDFPLRTE